MLRASGVCCAVSHCILLFLGPSFQLCPTCSCHRGVLQQYTTLDSAGQGARVPDRRALACVYSDATCKSAEVSLHCSCSYVRFHACLFKTHTTDLSTQHKHVMHSTCTHALNTVRRGVQRSEPLPSPATLSSKCALRTHVHTAPDCNQAANASLQNHASEGCCSGRTQKQSLGNASSRLPCSELAGLSSAMLSPPSSTRTRRSAHPRPSRTPPPPAATLPSEWLPCHCC